jgi:hypothetical protein
VTTVVVRHAVVSALCVTHALPLLQTHRLLKLLPLPLSKPKISFRPSDTRF